MCPGFFPSNKLDGPVRTVLRYEMCDTIGALLSCDVGIGLGHRVCTNEFQWSDACRVSSCAFSFSDNGDRCSLSTTNIVIVVVIAATLCALVLGSCLVSFVRLTGEHTWRSLIMFPEVVAMSCLAAILRIIRSLWSAFVVSGTLAWAVNVHSTATGQSYLTLLGSQSLIYASLSITGLSILTALSLLIEYCGYEILQVLVGKAVLRSFLSFISPESHSYCSANEIGYINIEQFKSSFITDSVHVNRAAMSLSRMLYWIMYITFATIAAVLVIGVRHGLVFMFVLGIMAASSLCAVRFDSEMEKRITSLKRTCVGFTRGALDMNVDAVSSNSVLGIYDYLSNVTDSLKQASNIQLRIGLTEGFVRSSGMLLGQFFSMLLAIDDTISGYISVEDGVRVWFTLKNLYHEQSMGGIGPSFLNYVSSCISLHTYRFYYHVCSRVQPVLEEEWGGSSVVIDNLSVFSSLDQPIVNSITAFIPAGSWVALVGPSGSGKSTLLRSIAGVGNMRYEGTVVLGGVPVKNITPRQRRGRICGLFQRTWIKAASILDNVSLARSEESIAKEDLLCNIERAQLLRLVNNLRDGLDTTIGPGGRTLSGGEERRVGIARLFYSSATAQIVFLDEVGAGLDPTTYNILRQCMVSAFRNRTVIEVTHTDRDLEDADTVFVMEDGRIVDVIEQSTR